MRRNIGSIQALRGVAAAVVVLAHTLEHGGIDSPLALFLGRFGVEIFFVVSGLVITISTGNSDFNPVGFIIKRAFRVIPLYWATTTLVAVLALIAPFAFKTTTFEGSYYLKSLLFIPEQAPGTAHDLRPLFKLGWTLNYEMFFYALVAMLSWCKTNNLRNSILCIVLLSLLSLSQLTVKSSIASEFYLTLNYIPFLFGILIGWALQNNYDITPNSTSLKRALALFTGILIYACAKLEFDEFNNLRGHSILSVAALFATAAFLNLEDQFSKWRPMWEFLGNTSYSAYLLHMFVVGLIWAAAKRVNLQHFPSILLPLTLAVFLLTYILSHFSFKILETPLTLFGKKLATTHRKI